MSNHYRIKDIAKLAGVSTGTVDRILHDRGKVSEEARKKVETILKEINYQPNLVARSLALKKTYYIYTIIPSFEKGEYWEIFSNGINQAEKDVSNFNIEVKILSFNQYDKNSFDTVVEQINLDECQGVVIATLFKDSVVDFAVKLDKKEIPYILVDAHIEQTNCLAYFGPHSYNSGYIAGRLLYEQIHPGDDIAIFRFERKGSELSTQVQVREQGFRDYLKEHGYKGNIHSVVIHSENQKKNKEILDGFLLNNPGVERGIIFNSRVHLLGKYFCEKKNERAFKLIGYDIIDENIKYLNGGCITHLIAQRPEVQGMNCIKTLFRHLVLKEPVVNTINYMPIDILVKENIQFYNNYI